jgi:phosphoglucosamine mutase
MSNLGLEIALRERGIRLLRTQVGDRFVVEAMRQGGYNLGGEQSGHMVFLDHNTTGDGVLSALQVLAVMVRTGLPLSKLAGLMPRIPQVLINLKVAEKKPLASVPELGRAISAQEEKLGDRGRVLVRYSGTEPKLRIMVEAEDENLMQQAAEDIRQAAIDCLGTAE